MMYKTPKFKKSKLVINKAKQGETIEEKIERIVNNKEPIKDGAPILYTERKEGIRPSTNIRTDRFLIAVEASEKIAKSYKAKREERINTKDRPPVKKDEGLEPTQGKPEGTNKA